MTLDLSTAAAAVVDDPDPHDPVAATLEALRRRLVADRPTNIGFPSTFDFDYTELYPFFGLLMNNVGDPYTPSAFPANCKDLERDVVEWAADLLHAPAEDRWGYVTTGGSEGNLYALHLARNVVPRAVVYYADSAHYSIDKAIQLLDMTSVRIRADQWGQIDYDDLTVQIDRRRDRPAVVVATVGTTMTEAVNDVRRVNAILDNLAVRERFVHADAALSGLTLATIAPDHRPGFDLGDGADSIAVSGHKFLGSPFPCGVVIVKASHRNRIARDVSYLASPDATITGSRSGHGALVMWYAIQRWGIVGLRERAENARLVAAYAKQRLDDIGWPSFRHEHALTVVLKSPPEQVKRKWTLATAGEWSHLITMPGITRHTVDALIEDIVDATAHAEHGPPIRAIPNPRTNGHVVTPNPAVRATPYAGNAQVSA
jgi:histidine decarboxylase